LAPADRSLWTGRTPQATAAAAPVTVAGTTAAASFFKSQEDLAIPGDAPPEVSVISQLRRRQAG
jgi:hypothetical protein